MAHELTRDKILDRLERKARNTKSNISIFLSLLAFGIFMICLAARGGWPISLGACIAYIIGGIALLLSILCIIGWMHGIKEIKENKHLDFWIERDICIQKKHRTIPSDGTVDTEMYWLYFEKHGKLDLFNSCLCPGGRTKPKDYEELLFEDTSLRDHFFLVFTEFSPDSPELILPAKEWILPDDATVTDNERIYLSERS